MHGWTGEALNKETQLLKRPQVTGETYYKQNDEKRIQAFI